MKKIISLFTKNNKMRQFNNINNNPLFIKGVKEMNTILFEYDKKR